MKRILLVFFSLVCVVLPFGVYATNDTVSTEPETSAEETIVIAHDNDIEEHDKNDDEKIDTRHSKINHSPTFSGPTDVSVIIGDNVEFVIGVNDLDGDPITVTTTFPDGASYEKTTGVFHWVPQSVDTFHAIWHASDGKATTDWDIQIDVLKKEHINHLPTFSGPRSATTTVGTLVQFVLGINDLDGDPITLSTVLPDGASYATSTSEFEWRPIATGLFSAMFFASDGVGTSTYEIPIEVKDTLRETPRCSFNGLYGTYFNLPENHPDVETSITGIVSSTTPFDYDWYEDTYFAFSRNDAIAALNVDYDFFPVNENIDGDPFYFAVHWKGSLITPEAGSYPIDFGSDDDGWVYINGVREITMGGIHPFEKRSSYIDLPAGTSTIDIYFAERHIVQSGIHFSIDGDVRLSPCIDESRVNNLPTFSGPRSATTTVGTLVQFVLGINDLDGDPITLSTVLPDGASYATSTSEFQWTPIATGTSTASFFAFDGTSTSTHDVVIEVYKSDNRSPYFVDFNPPTAATATETYTYDVQAIDPDDDTLSFSLMTYPDGMSIATSTGVITWIPTADHASTTPYTIGIQVSDGRHATSTAYTILVSQKKETPPPPPSGGGGGGGGGGANGPPWPLSPPTISSSHPIASSTHIAQLPTPSPVVSTPAKKPAAPSQQIPAPKEPPSIERSIPEPTPFQIPSISLSTSTQETATSASAGGRELRSLLFAGLFNFLDWLRTYCALGWLLWLLTLIAFLVYIFLSRDRKEENETRPVVAPPQVFDALPLEPEPSEYWETYPQEKR